MTFVLDWFDLGVVISVIALIVSGISLYLSWLRFNAEKPRIKLSIIKHSYKLSNPVQDTTDKASITIQCEVMSENKGNATCSVTDARMRIRYAYSVVTHPEVKSWLDRHVFSARPTNSEVLPFEVGGYGSCKTHFVFEFPDVYAGLLDRAIMPIDFRNPKKQDWNDFPIIYQLTFATSGGLVEHSNVVFNEKQEESNKVLGSIGMWEDWELDRKFSPLEHYKKSR